MSNTIKSNGGYDAVVVGARCAGAATAMLLARQGLRVLVVDRGRYGSDTLSTHALMRGGVLQLSRWGLLGGLQTAGTPPVRTTAFHYADNVVEVAIKPRDGVDALYAPRRTVLDALLVDAARDAGVEVAYGIRMVDLIRAAGDRVRGVVLKDNDGRVSRIEAGWVIGADGLRSSVARLVGAEPYHLGRHAAGVVYGYWSGIEVEGYHWYYRPGVSVGAIPTNDGAVCLFAAMPSRRFRDEVRFDVVAGYHQVLGESAPELAEAISGARLLGSLRGFPGQVGFFRRSFGPGWALVGDAAYFKDPITAHGITDALRDAELLARAVAHDSEGALADYQATRDDLALDLFRVTDDIASFDWDLSSVQEMHRSLSEEMKREVKALAELERRATAPLAEREAS